MTQTAAENRPEDGKCEPHGKPGLEDLPAQAAETRQKAVSIHTKAKYEKGRYPILWKGQKLAVTATINSVEVVDKPGSASSALKFWGNEYIFTEHMAMNK